MDRSHAVDGALSMMVCAFLWSTAGLFIKVLDWNPFLIAGMRSLIAFCFLLAIIRTVRLSWSWPLILAALANTATMLLFVAANKTTTAANAILLQYLAPVFTAIFGLLFLKERLQREQLIVLLVAPVGMYLIFMDRLSPGQMLGNSLALISAVTFALMFIFTRKQKEGDPLQSLMAAHALTAVIALTVAAFLPLPRFTPVALASIMALGVFQIGLASIFFAYGIRRIHAVSANLIALIEPVFNPVWVYLVLGEAPTFKAVLGGAIIIGSVTVASFLGGTKRPARENVVGLFEEN